VTKREKKLKEGMKEEIREIAVSEQRIEKLK